MLEGSVLFWWGRGEGRVCEACCRGITAAMVWGCESAVNGIAVNSNWGAV